MADCSGPRNLEHASGSRSIKCYRSRPIQFEQRRTAPRSASAPAASDQLGEASPLPRPASLQLGQRLVGLFGTDAVNAAELLGGHRRHQRRRRTCPPRSGRIAARRRPASPLAQAFVAILSDTAPRSLRKAAASNCGEHLRDVLERRYWSRRRTAGRDLQQRQVFLVVDLSRGSGRAAFRSSRSPRITRSTGSSRPAQADRRPPWCSDRRRSPDATPPRWHRAMHEDQVQRQNENRPSKLSARTCWKPQLYDSSGSVSVYRDRSRR